MPVLHLLPAILAMLLLAAHFFRAGWIALVPPCIGLFSIEHTVRAYEDLFMQLLRERGMA